MSEPLDLDLDAIEARAALATAGPWGVDHQPNHHPDDPEWTIESWSMKFDDPVGIVDEGVTQGQADADFIAHSRTDVPALIARVRELEARNTNLGIARVRAADALDRVALYGKNLTEVFRPETTECEIGDEILLRIVTNPLPSEGGPR